MTMYLDDLFNDHVRFGLIGSLPHATNYAVFGHGFLGYSYGANFIKNRWKPKVVETSSLWIQLLGFFFDFFTDLIPWDSSPFFTRIWENSFVTLSKHCSQANPRLRIQGKL